MLQPPTAFIASARSWLFSLVGPSSNGSGKGGGGGSCSGDGGTGGGCVVDNGSGGGSRGIACVLEFAVNAPGIGVVAGRRLIVSESRAAGDADGVAVAAYMPKSIAGATLGGATDSGEAAAPRRIIAESSVLKPYIAAEATSGPRCADMASIQRDYAPAPLSDAVVLSVVMQEKGNALERNKTSSTEAASCNGPTGAVGPSPRLVAAPLAHDRSGHAEFLALSSVLGSLAALGAVDTKAGEASKARQQTVTGVVRLHVDHHPCLSCVGVLRQFSAALPGVVVEVSYDWQPGAARGQGTAAAATRCVAAEFQSSANRGD
eukprot:NODE_4910_length_1832_cov_7.334311.p1 GENE.NODE_4910_length_1832_cov_7.334311~~NODE_4910_length_1832_cov_7.334311.p1  ORF type:complete len:318 (-),score=45.56 NODE_4910_length_1832_cov_7.334311:73-1026(-)